MQLLIHLKIINPSHININNVSFNLKNSYFQKNGNGVALFYTFTKFQCLA